MAPDVNAGLTLFPPITKAHPGSFNIVATPLSVLTTTALEFSFSGIIFTFPYLPSKIPPISFISSDESSPSAKSRTYLFAVLGPPDQARIELGRSSL